MIKYTLPDFTVGLSRNLFFINLWRSYPEYFIDELSIDSVYGCFPSCILNGGRTFIREPYTPAQIAETFLQLDNAGVKIRLTLTNMLARPEHLDDEYSASILDEAAPYDAEIIVYSDEVARALRERYGFKCVLSTTRGIEDINEFNLLTKEYEYVVLSYNLVKDYDFIAGIEDKNRVEVMVNEFCQQGCPHRKAHYMHNSEDQMNGTMRPFPCPHQAQGDFFAHREDHPVFLTDNQVALLHHEYGIDYFKIVGRGIPSETVLESYTYYLVKPEYRDRVKNLYRQTQGRRLG